MPLTAPPAGFALLELDSDASMQDIRRAYARRVKAIDQAADPEAFQRLRTAYEQALAWCERPAPDDAPMAQAGLADDAALEALHALLAESLNETEALASRFRALLDLPELQSIEVRQRFEGMLVRQLAAGWQPGHERLFEVAVVALAWDLDPERLRTFGQPGAVLCKAVHDRDRFEAQSIGSRPFQIDLMDRIRARERPSDTDLVRTFRVVDWLMSNYGQWLEITVGSRNLAQWIGWHDALPQDRRAIDAPHPEPTYPPEWLGLPDKPSSATPFMRAARAAFLFAVVLFAGLFVWSCIQPPR